MAAAESLQDPPPGLREEAGPEPVVTNLHLLTDAGPIPLGFAREGAAVYLIARERTARWPVLVMRSGQIDLDISGERVRGTPELVTEPVERARILALFLAKYGERRYQRWYDKPARVLKVTPASNGIDVREAPGRYYGWLTAEFDNVADDYDRHILGNRMNRLLRDRSLALLRRRFAGRDRLLEIGCGSGMETLPLLREGHRIVAVDISERMLAVVRRKAESEGLEGHLETRHLPARDLEAVVREFGAASFDGAYSTYGAFNCEPDLEPIPSILYRLLKPGAPFVAGIYNRWCLFEMLGYSLTLSFDRAWGRRANPIPVGASRFCVDVYAYSAPEFLALFRKGFALEELAGVPVILPPSDLTGYAERFSRHFDQLSAVDRWVGRRWPWNRLGDHFLATFARESGAS